MEVRGQYPLRFLEGSSVLVNSGLWTTWRALQDDHCSEQWKNLKTEDLNRDIQRYCGGFCSSEIFWGLFEKRVCRMSKDGIHWHTEFSISSSPSLIVIHQL